MKQVRINLIVASVMWSLALVSAVFNLLGLWTAWLYVSWSCVISAVISLPGSILTLVDSFKISDPEERKTCVLRSIIILAISVAVSILFYNVLGEWDVFNQWFHLW